MCVGMFLTILSTKEVEEEETHEEERTTKESVSDLETTEVVTMEVDVTDVGDKIRCARLLLV